MMIGDTPGRVSVRTGERHRRLTEVERQELRRQLRAYRRAAGTDVARSADTPTATKPDRQAARTAVAPAATKPDRQAA